MTKSLDTCKEFYIFIQIIRATYYISKDQTTIGCLYFPSTLRFQTTANARLVLMRKVVTDDEPHYNKPSISNERSQTCKHINTATKVCIDHKTVTAGDYN